MASQSSSWHALRTTSPWPNSVPAAEGDYFDVERMHDTPSSTSRLRACAHRLLCPAQPLVYLLPSSSFLCFILHPARFLPIFQRARGCSPDTNRRVSASFHLGWLFTCAPSSLFSPLATGFTLSALVIRHGLLPLETPPRGTIPTAFFYSAADHSM